MDKNRLRQYAVLMREKRQIEDCISKLELSMIAPKNQKLTGMPSGGQSDHAIDDLVAKRDELLRCYTGKLVKIISEQIAIEVAIGKLDGMERMVVREHYINGLTWEEVCIATNYSWSQVHRFHASALRKMME